MPRTIIGTVSSSANNKTIVVKVETRKTHPLYRKQYSYTKKYMAHDDKNKASVGDKVEIIESKPISAKKHFILNKIIERAELREEALDVIKVKETTKQKSEDKAPVEEDAS